MLQSLRSVRTLKLSSDFLLRSANSPCRSQGGRTAVYRRISSYTNHSRLADLQRSHSPSSKDLNGPVALLLRSRFSTTSQPHAISFRDLKSEDAEKKPEEPKKSAPATEPELDPAEIAYQEATRSSREQRRKEWERLRAQEEKEQEEKEKSEKGEEGEGEQAGERKKKKEQEKKSDEAPLPPHGNKSPWQVFTETLSSEFKASKEWNESTKQLSSSAHAFTQNESIKRAQEAYKSASGAATTGAGSALKTTGKAIGQGAAWTWETAPVKGIREGVSAAGRGLDKATKPIRDTNAFKSVSNVVDDGSSSRYGGWVDKDERRKRREQRELQESQDGGSGKPREKIEEDPNAGTNITLHKDSLLHQKWRSFRDQSPLMQNFFSLRSSYAESENPLISTARSITDRVAGFFAENETARVIKKFKEMDPYFSIEPFLRDMREYILPEVLDAYVKGDTETLKLWLSAPQYQVYAALTQQYTTAGLKSDGRVLDIRHVDILSARVLEPGEIPVFIISCRTQEVHVYRNKKTGDLAAGMEDKVQQVTYAIGVTRVPEDVNNRDTRGWRLIELQKSARDYI